MRAAWSSRRTPSCSYSVLPEGLALPLHGGSGEVPERNLESDAEFEDVSVQLLG